MECGNATNLSGMFDEFVSFNSDVSRWNVANATNLAYMFRECEMFNSDVSRWNMANATDLSSMFYGCRVFLLVEVDRGQLPLSGCKSDQRH
jgi:surface protein